MTGKELIDILKQMPPEVEVQFYEDFESDYYQVNSVKYTPAYTDAVGSYPADVTISNESQESAGTIINLAPSNT